MLLIKLGGSAITDKSTPLTSRIDDIKRLVKEIVDFPGKKIIVHGGGSFGHIKAAEYGLAEGYKDESQKEGICIVQRDMRLLNQMIVDAFYEVNVAVASIPAGAITMFDNGQMMKFPSDVFSHYLELGITPITFGDVVVDKSRGISICSGDDIMLHLARDLKAERCIFVTSVDGIFSHYPTREGEEPLRVVGQDTDVEFKSEDVDVTGSMKRKLDLMFKIASAGSKVYVINGLVPDRLSDALKGNEINGTEVSGD
jgi:isopentenyl phosphate kinase